MAKPVVVTIEHGSSKDAVKAKLVAGLMISARGSGRWSDRSSSNGWAATR